MALPDERTFELVDALEKIEPDVKIQGMEEIHARKLKLVIPGGSDLIVLQGDFRLEDTVTVRKAFPPGQPLLFVPDGVKFLRLREVGLKWKKEGL